MLRERLAGPLAVDRRGDAGGEALLAVDPEHARQILRRVGVDDVGGGAPGARVHPHVQRGVGGVAEAAVGAVQLQRGDAEVEQDALHLVDAEAVEDVGQLVEDGGDQGGAVGVAGGLDPAGGLGAGVGVAVQADQPEAGVGVEQRQRVAGQPERGVDEDGAVGGAGGGEEFGDPLEQDGHVHRGAGSGAALRCCSSSTASRTVRECARRWCRALGRAVGRGVGMARVAARRAGSGAAGRGGLGRGLGVVGRGGERVGRVGRRCAVGREPAPRGPPGVGEERQVAPRGAGVVRRTPGGGASAEDGGTEPRGRRLGPGPVEPRGRRLERGVSSRAPG